MDLLLLIVSVLYLLFILLIISGLKSDKNALKKCPGSVAILIPFRNEEKNLPRLVSKLISFNIPVSEIILADDHSEDRSAMIAKEFSEKYGFIKYISARNTGKKAALHEGINHSAADWIITLDADVSPGREWFSALMAFPREKEPDLICGPVLIKERSFFGRIQSLDLLAMVTAGTGFGRIGLPFICNGCNMVFKREMWLRIMNNHYSLKLASGDDVFFLHEIISEKSSSAVYFSWSEAAAVSTEASHGVKEFFLQRIRWGNKSVYYRNLTGILISVFVLLNSLLALISLAIIFFYPPLYAFALIYLAVRSVSDFLLLFLASRKMNEKRIMGYFPVAFLFHLVYVPLVALLSMMIKPRWKGRIA